MLVQSIYVEDYERLKHLESLCNGIPQDISIYTDSLSSYVCLTILLLDAASMQHQCTTKVEITLPIALQVQCMQLHTTRVMRVGTAYMTIWSWSKTVYFSKQHYIENTICGTKQCCITEDNYQADVVMCNMQVFMQNGMIWMIMQVTTYNVILCVTLALPTVVLKLQRSFYSTSKTNIVFTQK